MGKLPRFAPFGYLRESLNHRGCDNMGRAFRQIASRFRPSWQLMLGVALVAISAVLYVLHYVVFRDAHHIVFWSLTSLAFLPISVLFVTLIINRLLTQRQQQARLRKLTW